MLHLLLSVPLNSTQKRLELIFLLSFQNLFFFVELYLELGLHGDHFLFFKLSTDVLDLLCLDIVFDREVYLLLLSQVNDLFGPPMVVVEPLGLILQHLVVLTLVLVFHLFHELEGRRLVIGHVFVPSF